MTHPLKDLRAKAVAATPGPWEAADWVHDDGDIPDGVEAQEQEVLRAGQSSIWPNGIRKMCVASTEGSNRPLPDAAFIAAANPATVLALIDELEAAYRALDMATSVKDGIPEWLGEEIVSRARAWVKENPS